MNPKKIKEKFSEEILSLINTLNCCAKNFGVRLFFVGGLVRDILMDKNIADIDILVEGNAIKFVDSIEGAEVISYHPDFGTVKATINGIDIDFASTRSEIYPNSGCLPSVEKIACPIEEDIKRRDFTVNSILINLENFEIIDFLGGVEDIKAKKLKILHNKSFIDDPTRILRGLDFSLRFDFKLDEETKSLQEEFLNSKIDREFLSFSRVDLTLLKLLENNILTYEHIINNKLYKIFRDTKPEIDFGSINSASFLFDVNLAELAYLALRFEIPNIEYDKNNILNMFKTFKNADNEDLALYFAKVKDENLILYLNELKNIKNIVNGEDLISLGFKQGKIIGEILDDLLSYKLQNRIKNMQKEEEISWIREKYLQKTN